jgi:hypothetical protein
MSREKDAEFVRMELCGEKHVSVDRQLKDHADAIKATKNQITATLVFTVGTLISVIILILKG